MIGENISSESHPLHNRDLGMTGRIQRLKKNTLEPERYFTVEQALLITESYKQNEKEPRVLQRAKAFAHSAGLIKITMDPLELIVGNRTAGGRDGVVFPESGIGWIENEMDRIPLRAQDRFRVRPGDREAFFSGIVPYWKGKTLESAIKEGEYGQTIKNIERVVKINQKDHAQGHILPDVATWLQLGPSRLKERVESRLAAAEREDKKDFYKAQSVVLEAASRFMVRYAGLARQMADKKEFSTYRDHLLRVAARCDNLAYRPAETFHEAVQSVWFLFVLLQLESNASSFSPGRMDQYLLPYYRQDLASGVLNDQGALELIEALWLKFNQVVYMRNTLSASYFAGFPIGFNVAIGGQTPDGSPAVNDLSFLMLKAQEHIGLPQPNLSARLFDAVPEEFLKECARVIGKGSGMPQVFNDEAIIPALRNQGISEADARNYGIVGCVELSTHGNNLGWSDAAMFNMVKVIELAVNDGKCLQTGKQMGPNTGYLGSFPDYEAFECALEEQMNYFIDRMIQCCHDVEKAHARLLPSPFLSAVIENCIEKGVDVTGGGAYYNFSGIQFIQVANVADSLATIKAILFDEQTIRSDTLLEAMRTNFQNHGELREYIIDHIPKYGNDVAWVDSLGLKWARKFTEKISSYTNAREGNYHTGFYTVSAHVPMGKNVGASADGRLSGTPLADGGLSAAVGRDRNGPTALLKSVSRIDSMLGSNGTLLNLKMHPDIFKEEHLVDKFATLLKAMVKLKISHAQFNVVTREDLKRAQRYPDQYRGLTIRVAGYTAFFTELDTDLQNEIIARTEYEL